MGKSLFMCDPRAHLQLYTRVHSLVCTRNRADGNPADGAVERIASSFHCKVCSCIAAGIPERVAIPYTPPLVVRSTHRRELVLFLTSVVKAMICKIAEKEREVGFT